MVAASALAIGGGAVVLLFVGDGPYVAASAPFDPHAVFRVFAYRPARLATLGYLGHMWEFYAVWTWIGAFAAADRHGVSAAGVPPSSPEGSALAFVTIASGAVGSAVAGLIADRVGKARVAQRAMLVSGTCAMGSAFVYGRAVVPLALLVIVWGVAVVAGSAPVSALVAAHSPPHHLRPAPAPHT